MLPTKITQHMYWLPPSKPDRPSLCAVVGEQQTLLLDVGASSAHTNLFLEALKSERVSSPSLVVLTHWHWDHVFGAADLNVPIIAHRETRERLITLAGYDWSNEALEQRVASGAEINSCAEDIKLELPEPRTVNLALPSIVFQNSLDIELGGVTCHVRHVGGDHASDSCVIHVLPDNVLFLGDCLYPAIYAPVQHYTTEKLFPLLETILAFDAELLIEGHNETVMTRADLLPMIEKMRFAGELVAQVAGNEQELFATAKKKLGQLDEDTDYFLRTFMAGKTLALLENANGTKLH
jgi:glyoxylase-like metal-dependent hydrolase (beta-lactamase superfamily II)